MGFYWLLPSFAVFYGVFMGFTGFYRVTLGFPCFSFLNSFFFAEFHQL